MKIISDNFEDVMMDENEDAYDRIVNDDGGYAYLMESSTIQYQIERNCDLTQIGGLLDNKVSNSVFKVLHFSFVFCCFC